MTTQEQLAAQTAAAAAQVLRPEGGAGGVAAQGLREHAHGAGSRVPDASRASRTSSTDLDAFPVPTGREEEWRFTPLDRLRGLHDGSAPGGGVVELDVDAPEEVVVSGLERGDDALGRAGAPGDRVAALAYNRFARGLLVRVPREAVASRPVTVTLRGQGSEGAAYGHVVVDAEPLSQATVVLDYRGSATYAENVELVVGDGAHLTVVAVHDWEDDTVHVGEHRACLGRDARLRSVVVTLGGGVVRVSPSAAYTAPGGDAELFGLYFAHEGQHLEHRLFVDHAVPSCRSNVVYKGALQGESARTVWVGDVLIRAAAEGTDTYELNRNLVLTDGARADSVPNLEIETGEIEGAGHASATGRFDDEQLFYLQSRGIPEEEARRLVVRGFFASLLAEIGLPEVQERLLARIDEQLDGTPAEAGEGDAA